MPIVHDARVDWVRAETLAEASALAYHEWPAATPTLPLRDVVRFRTRNFPGFAASVNGTVVLAFCGTETAPLRDGQVLADLDLRQTVLDGACVHRGFAGEWESVRDVVQRALLELGATHKPLYVTGHSAGGAIATLAAHALDRMGFDVAAAYVYSSPLVGDARFADRYRVPLFRFENGHDLVPLVPPPAMLKGALQCTLGELLRGLGRILPVAAEFQPGLWDYEHVGQVFYIAPNRRVYCGMRDVREAKDISWAMANEGRDVSSRRLGDLFLDRITGAIRGLCHLGARELANTVARHHGIAAVREGLRTLA